MTALQGRTALVTGAASGIGRATAQRFVREGATVFFADRDLAGAREAAAEVDGAAQALGVDIADEASVAAAFAEAGPLDVVVANAGVQLIGSDARVGDLGLDVWRRTQDVNMTGTFLTLKYAVRAMTPAGGSIIVTGSPTALNGEGAGFAAYSASKAGVHGLARTAAADYADAGIRVNVVVPGHILTPLVSGIVEDEAARTAILSRIPMRRAGSVADVEGIMVYLAGDESRYATGSVFVVDGGMTTL
ncbi:SDR family NAD(P)-dependent oxidoreductase [uncultured Microbacterium sp.]|uniref:SDR family NAD(P)-dependent oxidoreductase n=1 Tax=uncultured Microbacterium sp. TaxID=191216 RepID=UPI0028DC91E5|nr:SDR family NAD(P)-dependent oxidoreductase [uncultured Microbacterium sp.]